MAKYKKQILRLGKWHHPAAKGGVLNITRAYIKKLEDNFNISPFVPVIRSHAQENEVEKNPELIISKNILSLEADDSGLNAYLDIDPKELEKYNDVSVSIDEQYTDHETDKFIGPMLKHLAFVTNPFIKGLNPFLALGEKASNLIINLSEIMANETEVTTPVTETVENVEQVVTAAEPEKETVEETVVDETKVEIVEETKAESKEEVETEPAKEEPEVEASETATLQKKIAELSEQISKQNLELAEKAAEAKYVALRDTGKATPAVKEEIMQLYMTTSEVNLSDGSKKSTTDILDSLFAKLPKVIDLAEHGVNTEAETSEIPTAMLAELRELPTNKKKSDEEFANYIEKNKKILIESSKKVKV